MLPDWIADLFDPRLREALARAVRGEGPPVTATATAPTARLLALATLAREALQPLLVIAPDEKQARAAAGELAPLCLASGVEVLHLPALDADPYRGVPAHAAVAAARVAALDRLAQGGPLALVAAAETLLVPVPPPGEVRAWGLTIAPGGTVDLDDLARTAVARGYRVMDVVTAPGDFARRGGLFDVWPPQEEAPLRVELFGDEVASVRRFDVGSQRSSGHAEGFRLLPAREAPLTPEQQDRLLDRFVGRAREVLEDDAGGGLVGGFLSGIEGAPALYREGLVPLWEVAPLALVALEPEDALDRLVARRDESTAAQRESQGIPLPGPDDIYIATPSIEQFLAGARAIVSELPLGRPGERRALDLAGRPPRHYEGRLAEITADVEAARRAGRAVVLLAATAGRRARLAEILADARVPFREDEGDAAPAPGEVILARGALAEGVDFRDGGPLLLTERGLFGPEPPPPPPRRRRGGEAFLSDLRDLREGDLVVHVDHGIGRYMGLTRAPATGDELLLLEYAGGDKLYVPVGRLDLIQKYSGGEQSLAPVDRLGGPGWDRRRQKARHAVQRIAAELLDLYARRQAVRAPSFVTDTVWQGEFESAFPHDLTVDQAAALADIKGDLAASRPMDRLLCGDVGYGKTEVALRAAFKVLQEGYQVAVLVPTTVLAFQHLATFRARMAAWPVRIEMVSRLVAPPDAKAALDATAKGEVDILVGTHRLLSKDVRFRKLGLLCIDEEQRFGVRHKEAIKRLSLGVHTLSMSATPIPRTLQMSLAGVRDLSVIETPPRNRLAIQTHLAPWSPALAAAAIRNELRRGGQIYYITPRVEGIEEMAARVKELVPEASVAHAHGQMGPGQLEKVMLAFMRGDVQVLVATTIIENGLDIPRANTILVNHSHRFGLSQLYQMRGRVGRSDQRAYAYLFVPPRRELTPDARRRLAALVEFSDLGAGFRIAALDLEIRGAGEFLGARQSGHIMAIGFELYAQLLEREVRRLSGTPLPEPPEPVAINLGVPSSFPDDYVPHPGQRLDVYKRLSRCESAEEIRAIMEETEDRFGRLPEAARNLFRIAELRLAASAQGAISIDWAEDAVAVRYGDRPKVDGEKVFALMQVDPNVRLSASGVLRLRVADPRADRIAAASLALRRLAS